MLPPVRGGALALFLLATACGTGTSAPSEPPPSEQAAEAAVTWFTIVAASHVEVQVQDRLAIHGSGTGALFRIANHGETALLVDLRGAARVIAPDAPAALRLPLSDAQRSELAESSGLSQVLAGQSIIYGVPFAPPACTGHRRVAIGGVLDALDQERTVELVADGADALFSCDAPIAAPTETHWVAAAGDLTAAGRRPEDFAEDMPAMLRAASVTGSAEVSLLPFSFDARPIERWRYDACVSLARCPERALPQPPGSIHASALGMSSAGAEAFCQARSLHALTPEQAQAVADPAPARVPADVPDLVVSGFRCARSESEATAAP